MLARTTYLAAQRAATSKKTKKQAATTPLLKSTLFQTNQPTDINQHLFDAKSYLSSTHFSMLSNIDQHSLKYHLFTPVGIHAISNGYITIAEFLGLSISVRETLHRLFNPTYADVNSHKLVIDEIFTKKHLTIDELKGSSPINREMLVRLVTNQNGLKLLSDGVLDKDDYLNRLSTEEQSNLLRTLKDFNSPHLECDYQALIDAVRKKISSQSNSL